MRILVLDVMRQNALDILDGTPLSKEEAEKMAVLAEELFLDLKIQIEKHEPTNTGD